MTTHEIRHTSMEGGEGLLAIVVKADWKIETEDGIQFITPPEAQLQLGVMQRPINHKVAPHVHLPVKRNLEGTSEILIVQKGHIQVFIYASNKDWVRTEDLREGDMIVLLRGGHAVTFIEASRVLEVKTGYYVHGDDKGYF